MKYTTSIALAAAFLAACGAWSPSAGPKAVATLQPTSGNTAAGSVTFEQVGDRVKVSAKVTGLKPNQSHGFHVHEKGDCSAPDGMSTGGHFNPTGKPHGPPAADHHEGDLPAIKADGAGVATLDSRVRGVADGPNAFAGKALIVHLSPDDYTTQPTGNSGARIACGIIAATPPRDAGGQVLPLPAERM